MNQFINLLMSSNILRLLILVSIFSILGYEKMEAQNILFDSNCVKGTSTFSCLYEFSGNLVFDHEAIMRPRTFIIVDDELTNLTKKIPRRKIKGFLLYNILHGFSELNSMIDDCEILKSDRIDIVLDSITSNFYDGRINDPKEGPWHYKEVMVRCNYVFLGGGKVSFKTKVGNSYAFLKRFENPYIIFPKFLPSNLYPKISLLLQPLQPLMLAEPLILRNSCLS